MKAVGSVIGAPLKALGLIPKMPKVPGAQKPITRDDARDALNRQDELFGRRGGAADRTMGTGGAEAGSTSKTQLG
jgi:hypothetical protein